MVLHRRKSLEVATWFVIMIHSLTLFIVTSKQKINTNILIAFSTTGEIKNLSMSQTVRIESGTYDFYSYKENGVLKFKCARGYIMTSDSYAVSRLVIEWESAYINQAMFGIVEVENNRKPTQIFAFTKTENTTVTDVHVPQHIFHGLLMLALYTERGQYDHEKAAIAIKPMFNDSSMIGIKNAYIQLVTRDIKITEY